MKRPMRKLPPLATLRAFEAAARHLSFKRAADELAVTPTAISHQIRLLEDTIGQRLFERRTRRVVLTSAGSVLYAPLRNSFESMAEAVERVRTIKTPDAVTLTATMAFTSKWLVPRVATFRARFPGINLRLLASDDVLDLRAGAADIAVRYGGGTYPGCRSQLLFQGSFAPVCSPRLNVRDPADLERNALIHSEWRNVDERTPVWPRWFADAGLHYRPTDSGIVFSDETHAIQAAAAGQGVALVSLALVADELANGVLVVPFRWALEGHGFHVVVPDSRADANVEAVREWLAGEAVASGSRMSG
jgi:LysR family transcriptional regulator, glycine cleavage system transcriptional activator